MVVNTFTKDELSLLSNLVHTAIDNAELGYIPLRGSALSPELVEQLSEPLDKRLLILYRISSKIALLKEEEN